MNHVIWIRNYLIAQGYVLEPGTVFQENRSAITLFESGKSQSSIRTRHIAIRFYFIGDRIKSKEIRVVNLPTDDMTSDILTKPLQGATFRNLRNRLLVT